MGYIMQKYGRENFVFLDNFIRMTVPYITKDREGLTVEAPPVDTNPTSSLQVSPQVPPQVPPQVNGSVLRLLTALGRREKSVAQLLLIIHIKNRKDFRERYLNPALENVTARFAAFAYAEVPPYGKGHGGSENHVVYPSIGSPRMSLRW